MSLFDLTGKVAVITGSTKGIGKASAFELAEHGAKVVISSRKQDACDAVAAEVDAKYGAGTAIAVAANISDKAALQRELHRAGSGEDRLRQGAVGGPERIEAANRSVPLRRIGDPEDIAGGVVFLASQAAAFTTGQTIVMDGGVTI